MLAAADRAFVRDAVVRARLGLAMRPGRDERTGDAPAGAPVAAAAVGTVAVAWLLPTSSPSRPARTVERCVYCGGLVRTTALACGFHDDLLELDVGDE